jgi:hypothetical protein
MIANALRSYSRKLWGIWLWRVLPNVSNVLTGHRSPTQMVLAQPAVVAELGPRVALFVHWDGRGEVRPYVLHYVRKLQEAGLSVLFVSNAGRLKPEAIDSITPYIAGLLVRRNIGYDFAAMREGLTHFALPRANTEMVILTNDSVYGPLGPLDDMLARIDFSEAEFWGATESWQSRYHLQSYFMVAGRALMLHPAWSAFWGQVRSVADKRWVITRYEVGITQWMIRAGIRVSAIWRYADLVASVDQELVVREGKVTADQVDPMVEMRRAQALRIRNGYARRVAQNPTSDMWRQLLQAGFPFLKRELLRDNPTAVADVMDWRDMAAEHFKADLRYIEQDLSRAVINVAP